MLLITPFLIWVAKKIRTYHALKFVKGEYHVDIGCGEDKYLLKRSPCHSKIGYDTFLGSEIKNKIPLRSDHIDCVTMIAVIEHFKNPETIINECHRILKKDGLLIITTPKKKAHNIIKLYYKEIEDEHEQYFDKKSMDELTEKKFELIKSYCFELGLNQLFVYKKVCQDGRC